MAAPRIQVSVWHYDAETKSFVGFKLSEGDTVISVSGAYADKLCLKPTSVRLYKLTDTEAARLVASPAAANSLLQEKENQQLMPNDDIQHKACYLGTGDKLTLQPFAELVRGQQWQGAGGNGHHRARHGIPDLAALVQVMFGLGHGKCD